MRSRKRRSAGSTSSHSRDDRSPSARRGRGRSVPAGRARPGGFAGGGRPGGPGGFTGARPPPDRAASAPARLRGGAGGGGGGGGVRSRNFGPDAPPKNKRKPPRKDSDRGPKGPIKERPVSKLYDVDEDWRSQDADADTDTDTEDIVVAPVDEEAEDE